MVTDLTLEGASPAPITTLIAGGGALFDVHGAPGELALVFAAAGPPPAVAPVFGGVPILLNPASGLLFASGVLDGAGALEFTVAVPADLPPGLELQLQAALVSPATSELRATNGVSAAAFPLLQTLVKSTKTLHPLGLKTQPSALVVADAAAWASFWDLHDGHSASTTPPEVDFSQYAVLCTFFGLYPTGGATITVDDLVVFSNGLVVEATLKFPGPGCGSIYVMTSPVHFVLIPAAAAGPVLALQTQLDSPPCP